MHHVMGLVLLRFGCTLLRGWAVQSSALGFTDASALFFFKATLSSSISVCNIGAALMSQGITEEKLCYPHISALPVVHFNSM